MGKVFRALKDRKTQYIIIIWILLIKCVEIATNIISEVEFLHFFAVVGFSNISVLSRQIWDMLVIFTVLLLVYRLSKDIFQSSLSFRLSSKKQILSLTVLLVWTISITIIILQFTLLYTTPLADPKLEVSNYYVPDYQNRDIGSLTLSYECNTKATLDLSRSHFMDPFSIVEAGQSLYGAANVGDCYFTLGNSPLNQKVIEMKFSGNGTDGVQGWFAYRVFLENNIPVKENSTLILLLKLSKSHDCTAWTYIKLDFLSIENEAYSLFWKFHDIPANYVFLSDNGTRNNYLLGSVTDWTFYQFNLNAIFYTSFSRVPCCVTSIEYGVGAEADNDVVVQFLIAKLSPQPLEINDLRIENVKPIIKLRGDNNIVISGLCITRLLVTLPTNFTEKNIKTQWSLLEISRIESYTWNIENFFKTMEIILSFNVSSNSTKLLLNGEEITSQPQKQPVVYELNAIENEVTLMVINKTYTFFMPIFVVISIFIPFFLIVKKGLPRWHKRKL